MASYRCYLFLLFAIRTTGKRGIGQASPLDFIIALAIGDVIDEITYGSEPLINGFAIITVWVSIHEIIGYMENRSHAIRRLTLGRKTLIIKDGKIIQIQLTKERVSEEEIRQLLRNISIDDISKIQRAYLEVDGSVSVFPAEIGR